MSLGPQAEALLKKLTDSGTQPFETITCSSWPSTVTASLRTLCLTMS